MHSALTREALALVAAALETDGVPGSVQAVSGGSNNALYQIELDGVVLACKLCVDDGRRRAAQEHEALRVLLAAGLDVAPEPLGLDESCTLVPYPAVVYHWLEGQPLVQPLNGDQLASLQDSFQLIHGLRWADHRPSRLADSWFHWFDFSAYVAEQQTLLETYGPWLAASGPLGPEQRERLVRLHGACRRMVEAADLRARRSDIVPTLCRVDANLSNAIWGQDQQLRWVDWEYCGWGDPALDLADMRWHIALDGLGDATHAALRGSYRRPEGDPSFDGRLALYDGLVVTRWCFLVLRLLWSLSNGPDRPRLSRPPEDPAEVRGRLERCLQRAEQVLL